MAKKQSHRVRMYCHPEFKKMVDIKRIQYGETDTFKFTKLVAERPELLKPTEKKQNDKKKKSFPSLF